MTDKEIIVKLRERIDLMSTGVFELLKAFGAIYHETSPMLCTHCQEAAKIAQATIKAQDQYAQDCGLLSDEVLGRK